jgi:ABC-type sulfate transport system permease component
VYDAVQSGDLDAARVGSFVLGAIAVIVLLIVTQISGRKL